MSNCVRITSTICLPKESVNFEQLMKDSVKINEGTNPGWDDTKKFVLWWFLGPKNMWEEEEYFCIKLGKHRSIHTWRDLKSTILLLGTYIEEKRTMIPIEIEDTDSGNGIVGVEHFSIV